MLLGRRPIAIATMASIITTRMAAASISTSFSVAQSPDGWRLVPSMRLAATPPASKPCGWRFGRAPPGCTEIRPRLRPDAAAAGALPLSLPPDRIGRQMQRRMDRSCTASRGADAAPTTIASPGTPGTTHQPVEASRPRQFARTVAHSPRHARLSLAQRPFPRRSASARRNAPIASSASLACCWA